MCGCWTDHNSGYHFPTIRIKEEYQNVTIFWREYAEPNAWQVPITVNLIITKPQKLVNKYSKQDYYNQRLLTEKEINSGVSL